MAWQNGNLNGNNSRYPEGGIVPFRLADRGPAAGAALDPHQLRLHRGRPQGVRLPRDLERHERQGQDLRRGRRRISSMCPSLPGGVELRLPERRLQGRRPVRPRRRALLRGAPPADDLGRHDHLDQRPSPLRLRPTATARPTSSCSFKATGSAVLLAWGGHLAQSAYWDTSRGGPRDGAAMVSGAPWHVRTLQLDGSGNKNQDRSIQPSAIVGELPPFALAPPTPTPRPTNPPAAPPPPKQVAR